MPITLRAGGATERGRYRECNEDAFAVEEPPEAVICVVADGLGRDGSGRLASERAIESLLETLSKPGRDSLGPLGTEDLLRRAFRLAHERVRSLDVQPIPGCSVTLFYWPRHGPTAWIAHLGDTAAERSRDGCLERLTAIHDVIGLVAAQEGVSYQEMSRRGKWRNVLCWFLGMPDEFREPDIVPAVLAPGDRFLLTSDGVWRSVEDADRARAVTAPGPPEQRARQACRLALGGWSRDDASAIVIDVEESE